MEFLKLEFFLVNVKVYVFFYFNDYCFKSFVVINLCCKMIYKF